MPKIFFHEYQLITINVALIEKGQMMNGEKCLKMIILGQNRIPDEICPGKFLHPEVPHLM